jgi:HTH-type transcriptional repressor of puuD
MNISERVTQIRDMRGMSQREVAELAGISASNYNEVERGISKCPIGTLEKICKALNITLSEFFKDEIEEITPILDAEKIEILKNSKVSTQELKQALKIIEAMKDK